MKIVSHFKNLNVILQIKSLKRTIITKVLAVLLFVALANAFVVPSDTPDVAASKMDKLARSKYEEARKTYRAPSLSYEEALVVAPVMMYQWARNNYEATRKNYEGRSLSYDEALAYSRSG